MIFFLVFCDFSLSLSEIASWLQTINFEIVFCMAHVARLLVGVSLSLFLHLLGWMEMFKLAKIIFYFKIMKTALHAMHFHCVENPSGWRTSVALSLLRRSLHTEAGFLHMPRVDQLLQFS